MLLQAGTTGKIYGRVTDSQTFEGLPGVNIRIEELNIGAVTDNEGYYYLINIPSGRYTVKAYIISYAEEQINEVYIGSDMSVKIDFRMRIKSIEMDSVYVEAGQIVRKDVTQQEKTINKDLLESDAGTDVLAVIKKLPGVVEDAEGKIHIRGGRDDEISYMIDGMSIVEPIFRTQPFTVSKSFVNEVKLITGGFNAEYGEAMSGVVNILTREGGDSFSGRFSYEGNSILPLELNNGDNHLSVEISGPILGNYLKYFLSGEVFISDYYTPKYHKRPTFFYQNSSDGYAFRFTEYEYTCKLDENGDFAWDSVAVKNYAWTDDSVPYFTYGQDTAFLCDTLHGTVDTILKDKPVLDTVVANPYNQEYFTNLGHVFPHNRHAHYNTQAKFTVSPSPNVKFNINAMYSKYSQEILKNAIKYNCDRGLNENSRSMHLSVSGNILASKSNLITFSVNRTGTSSIVTHGFPDTIFHFNEDRSIDTFAPKEDKAEWYEFWRAFYSLPENAYENIPLPDYKYRNNNSWGLNPYATEYAYPYYYGMYRSLFSELTEIKADWQSVPNKLNEMKLGADLKLYSLEMTTLRKPFAPYYVRDEFSVSPVKFSCYGQDKLEFEQMVLNFGLRFDYFDPKTPYYIDKYFPFDEPLYLIDTIIESGDTSFVRTPNIVPDTFYLDGFWPVKMADKKLSLSPRFGISYPMAPKTYLRFNYGHFYQTPQMMHLYANLTTHAGNTKNNVIFGYPDLKPEHLISYEVEVESEYRKNVILSFAAFYKDYFNLVGSRFTRVIGDSYIVYTNKDYANSKGLEFSTALTMGMFDLTASYTLLYASGTSSSADEKFNSFSYFYDPETGGEIALTSISKFMEYDQRHTFNFIIDLNTNADYVPSYLKGFEATLFETVKSGHPWSTLAVFKYLLPSEGRTPWGYYTDLTFSKNLSLGRADIRFFARITNVFDVMNVVAAYGGDESDMEIISGEYPRSYKIGEPYYDARRDINGDGVLTPQEQKLVYDWMMADLGFNPYNYTQPRTVKIGAEIWF